MPTPESFLSVAAGLALAAAAGFRVFVPLLAVNVAARAGWLPLSADFEWLGSIPAGVVFGTATVVEIAAYYVPLLDNFLDTIAAPAAVIAGIVASASVLTDLPPWLQYSVAVLGGGSTAGLIHTSTALMRFKSSVFTGGLGNIVVATGELAAALVTAAVAILFPVLALLLLTGILMFAAWKLTRRTVRRRPTPA